MNIGKFRHLCEEKFALSEWMEKLADERPQPQVSPATVFQAVMEMVILGQKSLLDVDHFARTPKARAWHRTGRKMVVSDSTLERSLSGFDVEGLQQMLAGIYRCLEEQEVRYKLPSGRWARVGVMDGSEFGGFPACVLSLVGKLEVPLGVEMFSRGKELPAARRLMKRMVERLGRGFVDYVAADGLYMTGEDLRWYLEEGSFHLVVKTSEETLSVIEDARGLFFGNPGEFADSLEEARGVDEERLVQYRVVAAGGFQWQGLRVKVAHVCERHLKPIANRPEVEEFWVITTDQSLSAEDLRELGHLRWRVENNVFKRLNELVASKKRRTHKQQVRQALLLIWFVGLTLLGWYLLKEGLAELERLFGRAKVTWRWVTQLLADSLCYVLCQAPG